MWHIITLKNKDGRLVSSVDMPSITGPYLCTCVKKIFDRPPYHFLKIMYYDADTRQWSDNDGHHNGISNTILAWRDDILPCTYENFTIQWGEAVENEE